MAYRSLSLTYRPATFADLVGQEAVAQALANAIRLGREPHGVIFAGVRGIGKTTSARLYAKALNCDQGPSPEPCDRCPSCLAITRGCHEDVLEIDGASHNGVDEVRALRETVAYAPQRSRFKIYIIDEVHMLSVNAFNALLKTLEEPPSHVVFVFATTELHKVPQTVIGRCQTFHLRKLSQGIIEERVKTILQREGLAYEDRAVALVAREGKGSMRDALTFLDQVIAMGDGQVTMASLGGLVASLDASVTLDLLDALVDRNADQALAVLAGVEQRGVAYGEVLNELCTLCRHGFVLRDSAAKDGDLVAAADLTEGELQSLQRIARKATLFDLNRLFRSFWQCRQGLEGSALDRFVVENYALEWCLDPGLPQLGTLLGEAAPAARPSSSSTPSRGSLTSALENLATPPTAPSAAVASTARASAPPPAPPAPPAAVTFPATWSDLLQAWRRRNSIHARKLEELYPLSYGPKRIEVAIDENGLLAMELLQPAGKRQMEVAMAEMFGFRGELVIVPKGSLQTRAGATGAPGPGKVEPLPESVLERRQRQQGERVAELKASAAEHPLTRLAVEAFQGVVEGIDVRPQDPPN